MTKSGIISVSGSSRLADRVSAQTKKAAKRARRKALEEMDQ